MAVYFNRKTPDSFRGPDGNGWSPLRARKTDPGPGNSRHTTDESRDVPVIAGGPWAGRDFTAGVIGHGGTRTMVKTETCGIAGGARGEWNQRTSRNPKMSGSTTRLYGRTVFKTLEAMIPSRIG